MKSGSLYIWNYVGRFGSQIITLLSQLILARILTPDDFGTIAILSVLIMVSGTLVDSGLGGALLMERKLTTENTSTIFHFNTLVSIIVYLLIFLFSPYIEHYYNHDNLTIVTRFLGLVFIIQALGIVPNAVLMFELKYRQISIITIISNLIASVLAIVCASLGYGVFALICQQLVYATINVCLSYYVSKWRPHLVFSKIAFRRMFNFGLFTSLATVLDTIFENIISSIYGKSFNVATAGKFYQAKKLSDASTVSLLGTINTTAFSILSKTKENLDEFIVQSKRIQSLVPFVVIPILIIISIFSREIISLLLGIQWIDSSFYLSLLAIAAFFMVYESVFRTFIKSYGAVKMLTVSTIIKRSIGLAIILLAIFIDPNLIIYGYLLSAIIACIVNICTYLYVINKKEYGYIRQFIEHCLLFLLLHVVSYCIHHYLVLALSSIIILLIFVSYYLLVYKRIVKPLKENNVL